MTPAARVARRTIRLGLRFRRHARALALALAREAADMVVTGTWPRLPAAASHKERNPA